MSSRGCVTGGHGIDVARRPTAKALRRLEERKQIGRCARISGNSSSFGYMLKGAAHAFAVPVWKKYTLP